MQWYSIALIRRPFFLLVALTVSPGTQYAISGSIANFTCKPIVRIDHMYWLINGNVTINGLHNENQATYEGMGYIFNHNSDCLTMSVPANERTNNTIIQCGSAFGGISNNTAVLIVIIPSCKLP